MNKRLLILIILFVVSGCDNIHDSTSLKIEDLEKKIVTLTELNNNLENEISSLENERAVMLEQYENSSKILENEIANMDERVKLLYRDALSYRNDIQEIFIELNQIEEYKFENLEKLTDEQRNAIIKGIEKYEEETFFEENGLENVEFIGDKPSQETIFNVLVIRPSTPKFYESKNHVIHLEYLYYLTNIPINNELENNDKHYQLRNFYDGLNLHHIVIENIDGIWECVYHGVG